MNIKEIFDAFDNIGCITFATIDGKYPSTRIAHFFAHDDEGLYFLTMNTKPFFKQLKDSGTVSACGMYGNSEVEYDEDGTALFENSYTVRVTGDVKTVSPDSLRKKAQQNKDFEQATNDMEKYRSIRVFVLYRGSGEIFDFDFDKEQRDHKLERIPFSFNGFESKFRGIVIDKDKCTGCGDCVEACTFDAIDKDGDKFKVNCKRCDVCGDCLVTCPDDAIVAHTD